VTLITYKTSQQVSHQPDRLTSFWVVPRQTPPRSSPTMTTIPPEPDTKKRAITYGDGLPLAIAIIGRRRADKAAKTLKRERKLRDHVKAVASFRSRLTAICDRAASLAASVSDIVGNNARSALLLEATCDVAATDARDDLRERERNFQFLRGVRAYRLAKLTLASKPNTVAESNIKEQKRAIVDVSAMKVIETMRAADDTPDVFAASELLLEITGGLPLPEKTARAHIDSCVTVLALEIEKVQGERKAKKLRRGPGAVDAEGIVRQTLDALLRLYLGADDPSHRALISHAVTRSVRVENKALTSLCLAACLDAITSHVARAMDEDVELGMQGERMGFVFHVAELLLQRKVTCVKAVSAISTAEASLPSMAANRCMSPLSLRIRRLSAMVRLRAEVISDDE
jgi:hypothetical protein